MKTRPMKIGTKSILLFATVLLVVACGPAMAQEGAKNETADQGAELANHIWFRWTGDEVRSGNNFEVVNGEIDQRGKKEACVTGREHDERYRVKARLTEFFDSSRFPFSDQGLTLQMEDSTHEAERLRYVADDQGSSILVWSSSVSGY